LARGDARDQQRQIIGNDVRVTAGVQQGAAGRIAIMAQVATTGGGVRVTTGAHIAVTEGPAHLGLGRCRGEGDQRQREAGVEQDSGGIGGARPASLSTGIRGGGFE
jgi:hypothetical protein